MPEERWTTADLMAAVARYEARCIENGLSPISVFSYVDYARRFVRWRAGEYRPRGATGPGPQPTLQGASMDRLEGDLVTYDQELRRARLKQAGINTYVAHATQFVRWLDGRFDPGATLRGRTDRQLTRPVQRAERRPTRESTATGSVNGWDRESSVQSAVVAWLQAAGWTMDRVADTDSREHGVDILAVRDNRRLGVEVKGYPQPTYERGPNAGAPKKWHPAGQARTYFGTAVHTALVMRDRRDMEVAIALPDVPGYRALLDQVHGSLAELGVRVFLVTRAGTVKEVVKALA